MHILSSLKAVRHFRPRIEIFLLLWKMKDIDIHKLKMGLKNGVIVGAFTVGFSQCGAIISIDRHIK